ncbi:MAG: hypothetical protein P1U56_10645 [Saprospiraceae bacterium]|nr:hypothetical protein [Saprospiraceae bacterium]
MQQSQFFEEIKLILNSKNDRTFKSQIANLLEISESGAYKKISGITQLTLKEAHSICKKLNLDISIAEGKYKGVKHPFLFYCDDLILPPVTYEQWASNILNHSLQLNDFRESYQVFSYQSELSYFHLIPFRHLFYFKLYAWNRSSWNIPTRKQFSISEFESNHALNSLLQPINDHFVSYESTEIWHVDFFNGLLNQIKYYYQLGIFENKKDLILLFKDFHKLITHLETMTESGHKRLFGKRENHSPLKVYLNFTHTSSNIMLINSPNFRMIYSQFLHPNYIRTQDHDVCTYTEKWKEKIISQSELISHSGALSRKNFIQGLSHKVAVLEDAILKK